MDLLSKAYDSDPEDRVELSASKVNTAPQVDIDTAITHQTSGMVMNVNTPCSIMEKAFVGPANPFRNELVNRNHLSGITFTNEKETWKLWP